MFIQKVLKGVTGIDDREAESIVEDSGIQCNWWRSVGTINAVQIREKLIERNLIWHLNNYDKIDPQTNESFSKNTPFISTTAGTVERDLFFERNLIFPAFLTALKFATDGFKVPGYIFYAYLFVLGRKTIPLIQFSEEVRELHVYTQYLPYHSEGEIVAKIYIPPVNIEKVEKYDPLSAQKEMEQGNMPSPSWTLVNSRYCPAERFSNIRGVLDE